MRHSNASLTAIRPPENEQKLLAAGELEDQEDGMAERVDSNFPPPVDSVTYRFHNAMVAVNASDAVAHCPPLPAG